MRTVGEAVCRIDCAIGSHYLDVRTGPDRVELALGDRKSTTAVAATQLTADEARQLWAFLGSWLDRPEGSRD